MLADKIVSIAKSYVGQQENIARDNSGFIDASFEAKMRAIGWAPKDEWCADFAILVWSEAYASEPTLAGKAKQLYSDNSIQMGKNFHADPVWPTNISTPKIGALAIYQDGNSTNDGHTGIVIDVMDDGITYITVEGNTLPDGETGAGYTVAPHVHRVDRPHSNDPSVHNLMRFVYPVEPTPII